ncbi:hypothetical protein C1H46_013498 [Malus baccata]|uniref:Uncharacterized protein n=1 Tax=Malus baccata TaxID=106549 RepID=A0A540MQA8_MALBA|nr:hypothetical protein C1H46_013498 [Malus baccata]
MYNSFRYQPGCAEVNMGDPETVSDTKQFQVPFSGFFPFSLVGQLGLVNCEVKQRA